jgi:hypothetical protein
MATTHRKGQSLPRCVNGLATSALRRSALKLVIVSLVVSVGAMVGCSSAPESTKTLAEGISDGNGNEHVRADSKATTTAPTPLIDHGGPVLTTSNTYAIFWGPSAEFPSDEESGVAALLTGFEGSSYLGIGDQYMRGGTATTTYVGATSDLSDPPAHAPKASELGTEVCSLFPKPDPNGIYFVFTSNLPHISYCAWHAPATCNGVTFEVAYMPNMANSPGCSPYTKVDLGCNTYSGATVSLLDGLAHEFMESVTDPLISAWYDKNGQEMADKCEYQYTACVQLPTATSPNATSWQIQELWSNAAGGCVQQ